MGHIVNPISMRLNVNKYWNSSWSSSLNFNYSYLLIQDLNLLKFFFWFFNSRSFSKVNFFLSHFKIYRFFNKVHFVFFIKNSFNNSRKKNFFLKSSSRNFFKNLNLFLFKPKIFLSLPKALILYKKVIFINFLLKHKLINKNNLISLCDSSKQNIINKKVTLSFFLDFFSFISFLIYKKKVNFLIKSLLLKNLSFFYNNLSKKSNCFFSFMFLPSKIISAGSLFSFIKKKMSIQQASLHNIMRPVILELKSNSCLRGFKIKFKGRFSRKQRGSLVWFKDGAVPLNSINLPIDYFFGTIKTKYGLCGVKIYLLFHQSNKNAFYLGEHFNYIYDGYNALHFDLDFLFFSRNSKIYTL